MKPNKSLLFVFLLSISTFVLLRVSAQDGNSSMMLQPPPTEKKPKITEINGDRLVDNFFWLTTKFLSLKYHERTRFEREARNCFLKKKPPIR